MMMSSLTKRQATKKAKFLAEQAHHLALLGASLESARQLSETLASLDAAKQQTTKIKPIIVMTTLSKSKGIGCFAIRVEALHKKVTAERIQQQLGLDESVRDLYNIETNAPLAREMGVEADPTKFNSLVRMLASIAHSKTFYPHATYSLGSDERMLFAFGEHHD